MREFVYVYGRSDDTVVVEGANVNEELTADENAVVMIKLYDGTVVTGEYDTDGRWVFEVDRYGFGSDAMVCAPGEPPLGYHSDLPDYTGAVVVDACHPVEGAVALDVPEEDA